MKLKKPTKKQVLNTALTVASFVPAVRAARVAVGVAKVGHKLYKAKKANDAYRAARPLHDHVSRTFRRQEEEIFKKLKRK